MSRLGPEHFHRWHEDGTGRYTRVDPLGLYDGPNPFLYADSQPTALSDPTGLAVQLCTRKTVWGIGNHTYFWDDRGGITPGQRSCGRGDFGSELGPDAPDLPAGLGDTCVVIPDSPGNEDQLMGCCKNKKLDPGLFTPFWNNCHSLVEHCIRNMGLTNPGPPGGRFGPPCNQCLPPSGPEPPGTTF